jgi:uncharacterized protein YneF (UPF0154 family)
MSNRAVTITGVLLGAAGAAAGFFLAVRVIQKHRFGVPK